MVIKLPWAGQGSRLLHAITAVEVGVELLAHLSHELRAHMTERRTRRSRKPAIVGKVLWTLPRGGSKCLQHGVRLSRGRFWLTQALGRVRTDTSLRRWCAAPWQQSSDASSSAASRE